MKHFNFVIVSLLKDILYVFEDLTAVMTNDTNKHNKNANAFTLLATTSFCETGIGKITLGARGFLREEPRSKEKTREKGEKASGCLRQLIHLTASIDLN